MSTSAMKSLVTTNNVIFIIGFGTRFRDYQDIKIVLQITK